MSQVAFLFIGLQCFVHISLAGKGMMCACVCVSELTVFVGNGTTLYCPAINGVIFGGRRSWYKYDHTQDRTNIDNLLSYRVAFDEP